MPQQTRIPLSERKLSEVTLQNLNFEYEASGAKLLTFACVVQIEAFDGQPNGPTVTVLLGVDVQPNNSIQELESAALDGAATFLKRLGSFSREELKACAENSRTWR